MAVCAARSESGDSFQMRGALSVAAGVSIHAVGRGATSVRALVMPWLARFQSTRPYGARPGAPARRHRPPYRFNPRARTGRDPRGCAKTAHRAGFNPRARTGRDSPLPLHRSLSGVSIHAPARGATKDDGDERGAAKFQSMRPHGARLGLKERNLTPAQFQSTRPHGARRRAPVGIASGLQFQSTRPHGARHPLMSRMHKPDPFQSTRPHGARPHACDHSREHRHVSIHAPARGATRGDNLDHKRPQVSIHAPARGATSLSSALAALKSFQSTRPHGARRDNQAGTTVDELFQSTRPHGARRGPTPLHRFAGAVSIHAPARGATFATTTPTLSRSCFNPRARTGRDLHRSRHAPLAHRFNPRARTGRDLLQGLAHLEHAVSIHAPARGATRRSWRASGRWWSFNPRARTGRDPKRWRRRRPSAGFNPRARTGRDQACVKRRYESSSFQSTRPHGARLDAQPVAGILWAVSIHAPARGATSAAAQPPQGDRSFNPRARTGRDMTPSRLRGCLFPFQSTRPHGARRVGRAPVFRERGFNPRARTGRDDPGAVVP